VACVDRSEWEVSSRLSHLLGCGSGMLRHSLHDRGLLLLEREPIDCCTGGFHDTAVLGCTDGGSARDGVLDLAAVAVCDG